MQSFQTELENPVVEQDIIDLEKKIRLYKEGKIHDEKFRSLRLARGIYGQRQPGVQMIRIKIPYGKLTTRQLTHIANLADEYAHGVLHATTRQDIQIHYVSLDRTPELWHRLEEEQITLREACGNTVRNITASATAGIDPNEPFDVVPYADAMFRYFLRNPVCQEMGRKFKIAFSSSEEDTALAFIHDLGLIPVVRGKGDRQERGFKVYVGGGLGAQPFLAQLAFDFLPADELIPFTEALLRVFDRFGERARRMKARLKFLLDEIGLEALLERVEQERKAISYTHFPIDTASFAITAPALKRFPEEQPTDRDKYLTWLQANTFPQRQTGFFGVNVRVPLGNLDTDRARAFAEVVQVYAADDIRVTINQGYMLRFVQETALPGLFNALDQLGLAEPGFNSTADITACPGTDTCNLGISSSTGIALALENVIRKEYPDLVHNHDIAIKISGCPNSCGQHGIAGIGFHGSSLKKGNIVVPALQVLLGGSIKGGGNGAIAKKVIKIPSKKGPDALRWLLNDYETNGLEGEYFAAYVERQGEMYFYHLLKPLTHLDALTEEDYIDWGSEKPFEVLKAVGECAGVIIDLVSTLLYEAEEKAGWALDAYQEGKFADAVYHTYNTYLSTAKALLLDRQVTAGTQDKVMKAFDEQFQGTGLWPADTTFETWVLRMNHHVPNQAFAEGYLADARQFVEAAKRYRNETLSPKKDA